MLFSCGFTLSLFFIAVFLYYPFTITESEFCFLIELSTITLSPSLLLALVLFLGTPENLWDS